MTTAKIAIAARTQLTGAAAALNSLAGSTATYVTVGTIIHNSGGKVPLDCRVELTVTPGTVAATSPQAVLFAQASLDGTAFGTGPASGSTVADEANLIRIGVLPLRSNGTQQRLHFSIAQMMPDLALPFATRLIVKNESGAAFAASGNDVYTQDVTGDFT